MDHKNRTGEKLVTLLLILFPWIICLPTNTLAEDRKVSFDGGPAGGTHIVFVENLAALLNQKMPKVRITVNPSGGSIANLTRIDADKIDMAVVNASDIERGEKGKLEEYSGTLKGVRAVARLYDEHAHLAVLRDSNIRTLADLKGKRVAVGTRGSGTWAAARRFFRSVGMWGEIRLEYATFDLAVKGFLSGQVEAVWQMVGYPSPSLEEICRHVSLRLIDLGKPAEDSGFYKEHPYYSPDSVPASAYSCVDEGVETFRDQAVWVASKNVDDKVVFEALTHLFSAEGLEQIKKAHPVVRELNPEEGGRDISIPFHPGAKRYWESRK